MELKLWGNDYGLSLWLIVLQNGGQYYQIRRWMHDIYSLRIVEKMK
jgi:hypothetical protein